MSNSLWPPGLQHTRLPCPSPTPRAYSNSCPSCWWWHPTISSSIVPFSSCLQSFPASGSFPMSLFFTSGSQSIGVSASASVIPMNIQDWFPLLIYVLYSRFSSITILYIVLIVYVHQSQCSNSSHLPPFSLGIHTFVLYVCVSISALQIRSSIPFF